MWCGVYEDTLYCQRYKVEIWTFSHVGVYIGNWY